MNDRSFGHGSSGKSCIITTFVIRRQSAVGRREEDARLTIET